MVRPVSAGERASVRRVSPPEDPEVPDADRPGDEAVQQRPLSGTTLLLWIRAIAGYYHYRMCLLKAATGCTPPPTVCFMIMCVCFIVGTSPRKELRTPDTLLRVAGAPRLNLYPSGEAVILTVRFC